MREFTGREPEGRGARAEGLGPRGQPQLIKFNKFAQKLLIEPWPVELISEKLAIEKITTSYCVLALNSYFPLLLTFRSVIEFNFAPVGFLILPLFTWGVNGWTLPGHISLEVRSN